jgi:Glycosyl hydrolase family 26
LFLDRQAYIGRKYDTAHLIYAAPRRKCSWIAPLSDARAKWIADSGYMLVVSWTHGWTISEVNAGLADACLEEVGARFAAWGKPALLRIYWEFNGDWMYWSGSGETFINAWHRTVNKIRAGGGTNVGFLWSPASGYRDRAFASYPGDEWVDWVGVSAYNWNASGAWCSPYDSGPWCELPHLLTHDPVVAPTVYDVYSQRKPFMIAEFGSVEDTALPGRKGQWFENARAKIPTDVAKVRGATYFDLDVSATENVNWRLDTSQSSLDGFRALALDPFFNTRWRPGGKGDGGAGGPGLQRDTRPPDFLGRIRAVPARFRVSQRAKPTGARPRGAGGTRFRYTLSEAARVRFAIKRTTGGRRVRGDCRAKRRSNEGRPSCHRHRRIGSFAAQVGAGANWTRFSGRLAGRALRPGRYRVLVAATDAAGNRSRPARASFQVAPPS